jgi:Transposase DDE domain/Domain of unknown function (DUF4372)
MRAFSSVFSQILNLFSRAEFEQQVSKHKAERHARGLSSWTQFVAMLFCQLGRAQSLREICGGLASTEGKLSHLGIHAPARSSLAYANAHRPWELHREIFYALLERCREVAPKHRFRFKNKLLSMDATTIDLCAASFDWAKFRRTKGGVKLHLLLDHDGCLPQFAVITDAKTYDINVARFLDFSAGSILVFDRGYNDFQWFDDLTKRGIFFVTRMKDRTRYEVFKSRPVPEGGNILLDEHIVLVKEFPGIDPIELRRIEMINPDGGDNLVFLTNIHHLAATTIAAIYKDRWKIETFFRTIKQNLRIKTFVGTSSNALHTQIWTALIAILILRYLQLKSSFDWSMSNLVALLRFNLFSYRDLWSWINKPFDVPIPPAASLIQLPLPQFGQQA